MTCVKDLLFQIPGVLLLVLRIVIFLPHYRVFEQNTHRPLKKLVECHDPDIAKLHERREVLLDDFYDRKKHEAGYVSIAGAVIVATLPSCIGWPRTQEGHWSGLALWYSSILLAIMSIFTAAQQSLVLYTTEKEKKTQNKAYVLRMRAHFLSRARQSTTPSSTKLFVWQAPIMFLGYSVFCFLAGLCSVVLSPLVNTTSWDSNAKTAVMFLFCVVLSIVTFILTSVYIHLVAAQDESDENEGPHHRQ